MRATRRGLLAVAGLAAMSATGARADDRLARHGRRLRGMLDQPDSAHRVSDAYLTGIGNPDWRSAALALEMPAVLAPMEQVTGRAAARAWLGSRIRSDFAAGAVIDVDGWQLSRTEVGACLLVAGVA